MLAIVTSSLLTPPSDARRYSSPRFSLAIWQPVSGLVIQKAEGHATAAIAQTMIQRLSAILAMGRIVIFDDWEGMTGYDTDARTIVSDWTRTNLGSIDQIHILVRSKLVAMAISVSNLTTNNISTSYTKREKFEYALAEAISARTTRER